MGDVRSADPDHLDQLADKLWSPGDGGAYGDLSACLDRARALDASGEMASLRPLLQWLQDAAEQLREGARILRGHARERVDPLVYDPSQHDPNANPGARREAEWVFEVSGQFHADEFVQLASKHELTENDISRLQGLIDHADDQPDFAAYLIDTMGVEEFLRLSQRVDDAAGSDAAQVDAEALQVSLGNVLAAAMWVPGDLRPGTDAYQDWLTTTPQGQSYEQRLNAFNEAGRQELGSGDLGYDVALGLLEEAEFGLDAGFFEATFSQLNAPFAAGGGHGVPWGPALPTA